MQIFELGVVVLGQPAVFDRVSPFVSLPRLSELGRSRLFLVNFGEEVSTEEAETRLVYLGFRPAKIEHLLASTQCDISSFQYIVALGSRCEIRGRVSVPRIRTQQGRRDLSLRRTDVAWCADTCFLAEALG